MTYSQYVINLRISHAMTLLRSSNDSVTQIAYECGFHNASSFIESFRGRYGVTPGQYRKEIKSKDRVSQELQEREGFSDLLTYASKPKEQEELPNVIRKVSVDVRKTGRKLAHTWKQLLNVGYARNILTAAVQEQIIRVQREIGFQYVRFHGLLDRDLYLYQGRGENGVRCNFTYFDMVLDFLLEQKLLPFLEFSFVPVQMAKEQRSIFDNGSVTAACGDCESFRELVTAIIHHAIERYGWESVSKWRFSTLQINYVFFRCMSMEEYLEIYQAAYRGVKQVDDRLQFGGPGAVASVVWDLRGFRRFMEFVKAHDCVPDFFTMQSYPHESITADKEFMDYTISQQQIPSVLSENPDFLKDFLEDLKKIFQEYNISSPHLILEEWNATLWQRDLSNDTCYKSVWLVKNICENFDCAEGFGYWLLTDFIEERADFTSVFHGGYGLITYNGIPKSGYLALRLLNLLGDREIGRGEGWFLTGKGEEYQLILYNYSHYDNIYRHRYRRLEKPEEAYTVFEMGGVVRFQITWRGIQDGRYRIASYEITQENGSAFDEWIAMGAMDSPNPLQCHYLKTRAMEGYREKFLLTEGELHTEVVLQPLEVKLILLQKV